MKKQVILFISLSMMIFSCSSKDDRVVSESDRQFIQNAYQRNLLDIQTSQIVRTRGSNEPIRRFSQQLIGKSSQTMDELLNLAKDRNLTVQVELDPTMQQEVSLLVNSPIEEFDDTYLSMIMQSRNKAISLYEKQIRDGKDNALREWASGKISGLKNELESAEKLIKEVK